MNILIIQPGFPAEIPYFVRGLAAQGVRVLGVGDQPQASLPAIAQQALTAYLRVPDLWQADAVIDALRKWAIPVKLDRVECLWEPGMMLAAQIRVAFGLPGMRPERTLLYRDKERMKQALDKAGIRTPRHASTTTESGCLTAAERIGYPIIIKPIAGAGSANTYKVANRAELKSLLPSLRGVQEVSIEEFINGKEFTYDTICHNGRILYDNVAWYRPNVLIGRSQEQVSPQTITLRDMDRPDLQSGIALGRQVLKALDFQTGFSHMEWFLTDQGEAVFGEIGARPPGGRSVEVMNYGCDIDVFAGWGQAVAGGALKFAIERHYNAAVIFKRAHGQGRIRRIEGLDPLKARHGKHIVEINLSPLGAPRRNWKQTLISDGYLIVRHPNLDQTTAIADDIADNLHLYAEP